MEHLDNIKNKTLLVEDFDSVTGIEPDEEEEFELDPFDPEKISIESKTVSMDACLRRLLAGTIKLNPDFQRNEVWTPDRKSQLIESLMLKIPLPMFYVSADEQNNFTVVDGLQRLSTIRSFILGDEYLKTKDEKKKGSGFKLQSLEFWNIHNGKTFNDLLPNIQNRILETEFRFTVINPATPEEVRRNIFKRLNTGGMPLSSQEIRNALYIGNSTTLLNTLAELNEFKQATGYSIKSLRMEDKELILRLLSFLVRDFSSYKRTILIDSYLSETMIILNSKGDINYKGLLKLKNNSNLQLNEIQYYTNEEIIEKFKLAMNRAHQMFEQHSFRKSYGSNRKSSINKSLFEMWGVIFAKMSKENFEKLMKSKQQFLVDYSKIISNYEFQILISRDSMKSASVKNRFEKLNQLVNDFVL